MTSDLENALSNNQAMVAMVAAQRAYTIDVKKMEQTNDTTSVVRPVQRIKSGVYCIEIIKKWVFLTTLVLNVNII